MAEYSPGLEGVIGGETAVCSISDEGLAYRGYPIVELAHLCTFEEVAYLLLVGELPNSSQLAGFQEQLIAARPLFPELAAAVAAIPRSAPAMDALRSAVSLQSHFDPEAADNSHDASFRKAVRLIAQTPALISAWLREGASPSGPEPEGHAAYLLQQVTGTEPDLAAARVLDASLILYAEHELNASTFAARVVVSTLSDLHSGIVAAIGALKGPLHGGANERAMEMLLDIGGPAQAESWVLERLARKERIMGFGHRVLRGGDSRARILHDLGADLARQLGDTHWQETADVVQAVVEREKGLKPNVDFPCGWVYHLLGLPTELYTPIFAASRIAGWSAHILEQLADNRLIRPRALYRGAPLRSVQPLPER
ncbi:MAG: citrate/2-methylcitrate synthase [Actinomycetota bacterium]